MVSPSMATHGPVVCRPHQKTLAVVLFPPTLSHDLVCEFTLVPLEKAVIRYLGLHGNAGPRGVCVYADTHTYSRTELYFHNPSRAVGSGVVVVGWWRWAWSWHVSANNHITHTGTHIPTSWSTPPTFLFPWDTSTIVLLPPQVLLEPCSRGVDFSGE